MNYKNIPDFKDYYSKANSIYFNALFTLLETISKKNMRTTLIQSKLISELHHYCEMMMQGLICEKNPLLIFDFKPKDYLSQNLDLNGYIDLGKIHTVVASRLINTIKSSYHINFFDEQDIDFENIFTKYLSNDRNKFAHTEFITEFDDELNITILNWYVDIFRVLNRTHKFSEMFYDYIIRDTGHITNWYDNVNHSLLLFLNDLGTSVNNGIPIKANQIKNKIEKFIYYKTLFENLNQTLDIFPVSKKTKRTYCHSCITIYHDKKDIPKNMTCYSIDDNSNDYICFICEKYFHITNKYCNKCLKSSKNGIFLNNYCLNCLSHDITHGDYTSKINDNRMNKAIENMKIYNEKTKEKFKRVKELIENSDKIKYQLYKNNKSLDNTYEYYDIDLLFSTYIKNPVYRKKFLIYENAYIDYIKNKYSLYNCLCLFFGVKKELSNVFFIHSIDRNNFDDFIFNLYYDEISDILSDYNECDKSIVYEKFVKTGVDCITDNIKKFINIKKDIF